MRAAPILAAAVLLTACAAEPPAPATSPVGPTLSLPGAGGTGSAAGPAIAADVPHVYMALQPDASGPISVIFAIDAARDNSPSDDPAIRITPEDGKCNPQEIARYTFPDRYAERPVFSAEQARQGISAQELPNFMAVMVTSEMMQRGLVVEPQDSQPQNVCTRKLWEQLVLNESAPRG